MSLKYHTVEELETSNCREVELIRAFVPEAYHKGVITNMFSMYLNGHNDAIAEYLENNKERRK